MTLSITFEHNTKADKTISNAQFEITKGSAPIDLTYTKQSKAYGAGGEISNADLLRGLTGTKTGYTIKTVEITNKNGTSATVSGIGTAAKIVGYRKAGTLTLSITFEHDTKADKTISNAKFEITKGSAPSLSYTKQTKRFSSGGEITNADLLNGVTGSDKAGYTIKTVEITNVNGTNATVSGSGTSAKIISYNKVGTLTLTIVLEHNSKDDVTLRNAKFEITKASAPSLSYTKQTKRFSSGGEITNQNLLDGVTGSSIDKAGYTIKTVQITNVNGTSATVSGNGTLAKITSYNKVGTLTLTIVLAHDTKDDVTLRNAKFEITKGTAPSLSYTKQTKRFSSGGEITNQNLLDGVTGSSIDKAGYTIKTVQITNVNGTSATVSGNGTLAKITSYNKVGTLTLTIVLAHDTKDDVTLRNAKFEITKASAPSLSYTKQTKRFSSGGEITNKNILDGVTGSSSDKAGYAIKTVRITNVNGTSATVSGNGTLAKITSYNKAGTLTLTIVLAHDTKDDVTLTNAKFEITKASAPSLSYTKQTKPFSSGGEITNVELLAGVTGSSIDKAGYTIKTVQITNVNGTSATVSGNGTLAKITSYNKVGTLTLTLVLEHDAKDDVTLSNAQFEITKATAPRLTWTKQTKPFRSGGKITNAELWAGVTGSSSDKTGYTIKTVNIDNHGGTSATVSGSGTVANITSYNKVGTLTLTIVLEHDTKKDVTLSNAQFEINDDFAGGVWGTAAGGDGKTYNIVTSATGKKWLDRNLGANRVATAYNDAQAYGDYYQSGRKRNGHEKPNSPATAGSLLVEVSSGGKFQKVNGQWYTGANAQHVGTRSAGNFWLEDAANLTAGNGGVHNPCPKGFRVPTKAEWDNESNAINSSCTGDKRTCFANANLKIPTAGYRNTTGSLDATAATAYYWCSTPQSRLNSYVLVIADGFYFSGGYYRSHGKSVRCISIR